MTDTVKKSGHSLSHSDFLLGMAHSKEEVDQLQADVTALEGKGVHTIVVVPLLVSSYSGSVPAMALSVGCRHPAGV